MDGIGDAFLETYSAWPLRFYALVPETTGSGDESASASDTGGWRVGFKAQPHELDLVYHFSDLEEWVDRYS